MHDIIFPNLGKPPQLHSVLEIQTSICKATGQPHMSRLYMDVFSLKQPSPLSILSLSVNI